MILLTEIVYAKPGEKFEEDSLKISTTSADYKMTPRLMNINELFHARDSMRAAENNGKGFDLDDFINTKKELIAVEYLINKKLALPFVVILFYFLGIFLSASFYKIHVIAPVLISYIILLTGWHYIQRIFEWLYKRQDIGGFLGANGATIIFSLLVLVWFYVLKKYKLFETKDSLEQADLTSILDTH